MLKLYWHCIGMDEGDSKFVSDNLQELSELLWQPPTSVRMKPEKLPLEFSREVGSVLLKPPSDSKMPFTLNYVCPIRKKIAAHEKPLLIYCRADSNVARAAKRESPKAFWGLCSEPPFPLVVAVYERGNKHILWHEALHLFGVVDCYDYNRSNNGTNCELNNCLMQFAPSAETIGGWPFLCKKNIEILPILAIIST